MISPRSRASSPSSRARPVTLAWSRGATATATSRNAARQRIAGAWKQSGGYITVASVEGRGTTFSIWFPAATWTPEPAGRAGESPPPAAAERAQRHLADAGYVVLPAAGGEEALAAARAHGGTLHLLLTDVVMPGIGGLELAARLKDIHP
jgi:two-component system cell cycle sensor histidine kinase/response regulator CckA